MKKSFFFLIIKAIFNIKKYSNSTQQYKLKSENFLYSYSIEMTTDYSLIYIPELPLCKYKPLLLSTYVLNRIVCTRYAIP